MNVFSLDRHLIREYASFARSFTKIRAHDIAEQVEHIYAQGTFWPEPLVSINPHYQSGSTLAALVRAGDLCVDIENVFRVDGKQVKLYKHQSQAVAKARQGQSFVVTTGTGSGKSLCFFIPIIDAALRAHASASGTKRTKAIVIYPMNAFANSQMKDWKSSSENPEFQSLGGPPSPATQDKRAESSARQFLEILQTFS